MKIQEFQRLSGFFPAAEFYKWIEAAYYEFDGSKQEFCSAYKQNKNGLAERIAQNYDRTAEASKEEQQKMIAALTRKNEQLKKALEVEEEWKPHECQRNVKQADYEHIRESGAKEMTDEEAANIIANEFGFERSKIRIVHEVCTEEINRHGKVRQVGTYQRDPLFKAWDWNYIRFDILGTCTRGYEMYNGELQQYCQ